MPHTCQPPCGRYSQESDYAHTMATHIHDFWETRQEGYTKAYDGIKLYWCSITSPKNDKAVLVVNGRIESAWKYQEVFYDLFQRGYNIYSFDHRGQGLSQRLVADTHMGHVNEFDDYLQDMNTILSQFDLNSYRHRYLLAHSMGAAISTRYIQTHPQHPFHAIALSAPMFGINMSPWLQPIALVLAQLFTACTPNTTYAPGCKGYTDIAFSSNKLTQSKQRYQWIQGLYQAQPKIQLGGPSNRWVWQALMACKQCLQLTRQIRIPLLLLQASQDKIVDNSRQRKFIRKLRKVNKDCDLKVIEGSRHEPLFEQDKARHTALDNILSFYTRIKNEEVGSE
ncbi:alpha/beta fold hydrolase [Vibrio profundum]|uniref:alpha/beta fold hydrolase n=1 Tax=Vibrio profundum TaxID=2910247 RepID=UPI003D0E1C40